MGADYQDVILTAKDVTDLRVAYSMVVEECLYMSGRGGYTGTLAEKRGLKVIRGKDFPPCTRDDAYNHCLNHNEKWGPSYAYWMGENRWYVGGWCSC